MKKIFKFDLQRFSDVKTYDPKKNVVVFGARQITGFSEDTIISIEPSGEGVQKVVGADGEVARSLDPNETFKVTFSLLSTSTSNEFLSEVYNLDRKTGSGMLPLMIKDLSGSTMFIAEKAWVANFPSPEIGRTVNTYEWEIDTGQVSDPILGGND